MRNVAFMIAVIILAIAGFVGYEAWSSHQSTSSRDQLDRGYQTQPLTDPFKYDSKAWNSHDGTWKYIYAADLSQVQSVAEAKSQLSKGAYQVHAHRPDVVKPDEATLYRDLITEDVALEVHIYPNPATKVAPGNPATIVTVTLSPMQGN